METVVEEKVLKVPAWKFVKWDVPPRRDINPDAERLDFDFQTGTNKVGGWLYDLRPFLKKYLVKYSYESGVWRECWARSVKELREKASLSRKDRVIPFPED